ncbi:VanZ family protein [Maricaulis sp.]|uniref:VanZ family protein n=1 Tax=Maricaulis sp. TaxID=1486257 RepID=UPI002629EC5E|nr:VanZ family protein [Maricaulis sp.]
MSTEPKNTQARRPDAGLRWAGRVLFLTTSALVLDLAFQPGHATQPDLFGFDKLEHIAAFFTLTVLMRIGWPGRAHILQTALLMAFGLFIELVQATDLVGRTASWADVVADMIGILIGMFCSLFIGRRL